AASARTPSAAWRRWSRPTTASRSRRSTCSCAVPASSSAHGSPACRSSGSPTCCAMPRSSRRRAARRRRSPRRIPSFGSWRSVARATFVERDARAGQALRANVTGLGVERAARVVRGDVRRALQTLRREAERFDVVFLDPPYEGDDVASTLDALGGAELLGGGAVVIAQHRTKRAPAASVGALSAFRTRRFGETTLTFFRRAAADEGRASGPVGG